MPPFQDPEIYRDILDGLQIGVSVLDLHKKIVFWSDGAEQITGYARIDVLGHSCAENILLHCNQTSCETCSGKCPMASALHDAKPVESMRFHSSQVGTLDSGAHLGDPAARSTWFDNRNHPDI